jgi:hypothetical protein
MIANTMRCFTIDRQIIRRCSPVVVILLGLVLGTPLSADEAAHKTAANKPTLGDIINRAAESVVLITTESGSGTKIGFGSGFVIDARG